MKQERIDNSTKLLLELAQKNEDYEITLRDNKLTEIDEKLKWFNKNLKEVTAKVKNTEWYKNYPTGVNTLLDSMRNEYKMFFNSEETHNSLVKTVIESLKGPRTSTLSSEQAKWLSENEEEVKKIIKCNGEIKSTSILTSKLIDLLIDKYIAEEQSQYNTWVENKVAEIVSTLSTQYKHAHAEVIHSNPHNIHRPIVWGTPGIIRTKEGFKDDFAYYGKTLKKTVYIPFTGIHQKLIESNWIMRKGEDQIPNYLLTHILFVVANKGHVKDGGEYSGGRSFIDFPIVYPLSCLQEGKQFGSKADYKDFVKKQGYIGQYCYGGFSGKHSEPALTGFMNNTENVQSIVATLKSKLAMKYSTPTDEFKVYAVNLFINSQKNVCNAGQDGGCEKALCNLMTSTAKGTFLDLLKTALNNNDIKTSGKHHPYAFITVSAHQYYDSYCTQTLIQDAANALEDSTADPYRQLSIDIKQIAGKVILSTAEQWLDGQTTTERKNHIKHSIEEHTAKIPFYSGFRSAGGTQDKLAKVKEQLDYDIPQCFDDIGIFILGAEAESS